MGSNDLRSRSTVELSFKRLVSHRQYRSDTFENDIALLETEDEMQLYPRNPNINAICLPERNKQFTGLGSIAGWGRTSEGGDESDILKAADVELMRYDLFEDESESNSISFLQGPKVSRFLQGEIQAGKAVVCWY